MTLFDHALRGSSSFSVKRATTSDDDLSGAEMVGEGKFFFV